MRSIFSIRIEQSLFFSCNHSFPLTFLLFWLQNPFLVEVSLGFLFNSWSLDSYCCPFIVNCSHSKIRLRVSTPVSFYTRCKFVVNPLYLCHKRKFFIWIYRLPVVTFFNNWKVKWRCFIEMFARKRVGKRRQ